MQRVERDFATSHHQQRARVARRNQHLVDQSRRDAYLGDAVAHIYKSSFDA